MENTKIQQLIKNAYMNLSWRPGYCNEIELLAAHGRVTRNVLTQEFISNWVSKMLTDLAPYFALIDKEQNVAEVNRAREILNTATMAKNWKPLGEIIEKTVQVLKAAYASFSPPSEGRVVNRFTDRNRLGWTKAQWDHYLNVATPMFRRMIANIKKTGSVQEVLSDAKALWKTFQTEKGTLAYPGLDRQFRDLIDTLEQLPTNELNKQQRIVLANVYDKKILPRLHMMWMFARQEPVR